MTQSLNPAEESRPRRILVADDDGHIREVVRFALSRAGYDVVEAADGRAALNLFEAAHSAAVSNENAGFDLVVLDILMPGLDGLDVCRRIREKSRIPLIFVSSKDEELDRILGLELGADDYITKPFSPRELVARVKAALRRYNDVQDLLQEKLALSAGPSTRAAATPEPEHSKNHGPLRLDLRRHECTVGERNVVLTVSEFALLHAVLASGGRVLTRRQLVDFAYGDDHFLSDRTVDSHIRRIRKKLAEAGHQCIETVYGVGYRLSELS